MELSVFKYVKILIIEKAEVTVSQKPSIPQPDISSKQTLEPWVKRYVNTISSGMRDKSTKDMPLTDNQLLALEQQQFYNMLKLIGKVKDEDLKKLLVESAEEAYDPTADPLNKKKTP